MTVMESQASPSSKARDEYSRLAKKLEGTLLTHALRMCAGDIDWARDLAQEALIKGYGAYLQGSFGRDTNAKAWLLRILTNTYINQYNRKKKWESGLDINLLNAAEAPAKLKGTSTSPEDVALLGVLDEPLQNALNALQEDQRICVVLVDIEQNEYSEVAKMLDVPVGTVRSRLARARLKLYTSLLPYAKNRRLV
jgi:RNA polymerase sigma-70 factor (ECF subfamily)